MCYIAFLLNGLVSSSNGFQGEGKVTVLKPLRFYRWLFLCSSEMWHKGCDVPLYNPGIKYEIAPSNTRRNPMTALLNILADLDSVKFNLGLIIAVIGISLLLCIIAVNQTF